MTSRLNLTWLLLLFLVALFLGGTPGFADTPTAPAPAKASDKPATATPESSASLNPDQQAIKSYLTELFEASKGVNADGKERAASRSKIEGSVDWNKISEMCIGGAKRWKAQSEKNRSEFSRLLKEIITLTAYSRMSDFWKDTTYAFKKIDVKGSTAEVEAKFTSKKEDYVLSYYLHRIGKAWRIYDLAFDDLRYSENIHEQIDAFLKEKNFAQLLDKLRKRKAELLEDEKKGKKA